MSYTTIYCNEQMLLDNWRYYDEPNQKLRNLLSKTYLSDEQCAEFYLDHMHNRESVNYSFDELVYRFHKQRSHKNRLLVATEVPIYQGDIDYITQANIDYGLSVNEMRVLFAVIFLCRLYETDIVKLDSRYKLWGFTHLYKNYLSLAYVRNGGSWYDAYNTIDGLPRLSDELHLLDRILTNSIGCYYEYLNYEVAQQSKVAYTYKVTVENNRLCLSDLFKGLIPCTDKRCMICGRKIIPDGLQARNRSKYCKECAESKERYRMILKYNVFAENESEITNSADI